MLFYFLAKRSVSEITILTEQHSSELFGLGQEIPTFVELTTQEENKNSSFYNVAKKLKYYKTVQFARINCTTDTDFCDMFPDFSGETDYYWVGRFNKEPLQFLNKPTIEGMELFIAEQLKSTLIIISSLDEINEYQKHNEDMPYFIFNVYENSTDIKSIAENVTQNLRHIPAHFYYFENPEERTTPTLTSVIDGRTAIMSAKINEVNVETFIRRRSIPFFSLYSDHIGKFSELHNIPVAIFVSPENSTGIYDRFAEESDKLMLTTHATCSQSPWICRYTNQRIGSGYIAIVNRQQRSFWVYDSIADSDLVRHWLEDVNDGMLRGYGGSSGIGKFLSPFYEWRAVGGLSLSLFALPAAVYVILIALFIELFADKVIKAIRDRRERLERERREAEEAAKKRRRRIE